MLERYETKKTPDGCLDYQLVSVHVSMQPEQRDFQRRVLAIAEEAATLFVHPVLELVDVRHTPLLGDLSIVHQSRGGEIADPSVVRSKHVVLVGKNIARCHGDAYQDVLAHGAQEVHMPIDGIESVNETPFTAFGRERIECVLRSFYTRGTSRKNEGKNFRVVLREDGECEIVLNEAAAEEDPLVIVHQTWKSLRQFLEAH